jgi:hypothetical protein
LGDGRTQEGAKQSPNLLHDGEGIGSHYLIRNSMAGIRKRLQKELALRRAWMVSCRPNQHSFFWDISGSPENIRNISSPHRHLVSAVKVLSKMKVIRKNMVRSCTI